ncbi:Crp/Fnr family transcriptional regulator [Hymenobacter sp. RP-2-7]|uniref:Crp/Fnr family transcriptional regulator n=1 Tax=Hymenobacter polaris TaxID=2682546 RepID=A0A7Y0AIB3_9BACT|nr:Crp/Fnr family transcriptional regulator [Hymenobacter polaris]NML67898.1 Crp/Fnr family transcriptional regulator [Hymenobacter polaris]
MQDVSALLRHFEPHLTLTQAEQDLFISVLREKQVKRKQFVEQPGYVSTHRSYVVRGALRAFFIDASDQEQTIAMAVDDGWIGDPGSFLLQEPATLFVEALEDSTLLQWSYASEQLLLDQIPQYARFMMQKAQLIAVGVQRRLISLATLSAEQRYAEFARNYPVLVQRMPLYVIASYLGMTREFLSKIRNQKISSKSRKE